MQELMLNKPDRPIGGGLGGEHLLNWIHVVGREGFKCVGRIILMTYIYGFRFPLLLRVIRGPHIAAWQSKILQINEPVKVNLMNASGPFSEHSILVNIYKFK